MRAMRHACVKCPTDATIASLTGWSAEAILGKRCLEARIRVGVKVGVSVSVGIRVSDVVHMSSMHVHAHDLCMCMCMLAV